MSALECQPLISVLVPIFNVERFVEEALQSIANQTYTNIEVIVVDDGSSDETVAIASRFATGDCRFKVLRNESNRGIVCTLNRALRQARGELIARCDGDDVMLPTRLEAQYSYLKTHPNVALVGCSFATIDEEGRELRKHVYPTNPAVLKRLLPYASPVSHIWLAWRSVYDHLGGYRLASVEDYDFLLRADLDGFLIDNVPNYIGMKVRLRSDNTIGRYGLTQRMLFNYARRLYRGKGALTYSEATEAEIIRSSRTGLMQTLHYAADRLTQRGAKSPSRPLAMALYLFAALLSPYKAQYFIFQLMVKLIKRSQRRDDSDSIPNRAA